MDDSNDLFSRVVNNARERQMERQTGENTVAQPVVQPAPSAPKPVPAAAKAPPAASGGDDYNASSIRVLEGLEPVRLRPGMYIGGTDEKALHHLFAEVIDNSMDEAVAGHANFIEVTVDKEGFVTVSDNGRGIPVDEHPQVPGKSTLEVIMTKLHAGGKFDGKAYETSGGLHGVGVSVVNALSDVLEVEVARNRRLYRQCFSRGIPQGGLEELGEVHNRRGTRVRFHPDPEIFGKNAHFDPHRLYRMARSKAYLFGGVEIRWNCDPSLLDPKKETPEKAVFHFPGGLKDYLEASLGKEHQVTREVLQAARRSRAGMARLNGPLHGSAAMVLSIPIAIPSRPAMAARMKRACASRSRAASRPTRN